MRVVSADANWPVDVRAIQVGGPRRNAGAVRRVTRIAASRFIALVRAALCPFSLPLALPPLFALRFRSLCTASFTPVGRRLLAFERRRIARAVVIVGHLTRCLPRGGRRRRRSVLRPDGERDDRNGHRD